MAASRCADSSAISSPSRSNSSTGVARTSGEWISMVSPLLLGRLYTAFSEPPASLQNGRSRTRGEFFDPLVLSPIAGPERAA